MSKRARFDECRAKMLTDMREGRPLQREHMKRFGASKIAMQTEDVLERRQKYDSKHFALGALRSICYKAGKKNDWIEMRLFGLLDRNNDLHAYDVLRRIGACYIKFLPQRIAT